MSMRGVVSNIFRQKTEEIQSRVPVKLFKPRQSFKDVLDGVASADAGARENTGCGVELFQDIIRSAAEKYGIDENIVKAVIKAESGFNPNAVSSAGAAGLMQLMPATASMLGVDNLFDPKENIDGGTRYLAHLLNLYGGDLKVALAAYNCGSGTLARQGVVSLNTDKDMSRLYRETRNYVNKVINDIGGSSC